MLRAAGLLALFLALAHSALGERYLLVRLFRRADLPKLLGSEAFTRQVLRFAWHLTSVAWAGFAALLMLAARDPLVASSAVPPIVAVTMGASGAVALVGSRGRHLSWVVFFAIAALAWWGSRG